MYDSVVDYWRNRDAYIIHPYRVPKKMISQVLESQEILRKRVFGDNETLRYLRWEASKSSLIKCAEFALFFVENCKCDVPEVEPLLAKNGSHALGYARLRKRRFEMGELAISRYKELQETYNDLLNTLK